jgi:competence protein ComEC
MLKWIPYVLVRVTLFFIAGILIGIYLPDVVPEKVGITSAFTLLIVYFIIRIVFRGKRYLSLASGFIGLVLITVCGYLVLLQKTDSRKPNHLINFHEPIQFYEAVVITTPESKQKSWKTEVEITKVLSHNSWKGVTGNVLLYISKRKDSIQLNYGDVILVKGAPPLLQSPGNPLEFDFKRFLSFRNIYHQQFTFPGDLRLARHATDKGFLYYASQARQKASSIMRKHLPGQREQAIALALVLGVNDGLDNDLQNAYSASGAMHVLSVSGLHVSILYLVILFFLKPIQPKPWSPWVIAAVSVIILWFYAFITGLSPSVLRAVTMFTFIAIARPFGRRSNIYNTLAASAFILLIYNPYLIMSVGFQLSYIAVIGIVYLQRPLYNLWEPQNKILDWVWRITCVSIAAQIATFALGLLYFHQFPVYFLFSNLFVIPGSFVVLLLGVFLLVIDWLAPVASLIGYLLNFSIKILNGSVFLVEDLPYSLINNVYLTTFQCWLLIAMIFTIIFLLEKRSFHYALATTVIGLIFSLQSWLHFKEKVNTHRFVVYKVPGHSAVDFIDKGQSVFIADSALMNDEERIRFHIRPNRLFCGVAKVHTGGTYIRPNKGFDYFIWKGKRILFVKDKKAELPGNINADYLIIANNSMRSDQLNSLAFRTIILDSSNTPWYCDRLQKESSQANIYSVLSHGAFIENSEL